MNELLLFTDGSVNTSTKIGYGAYLYVSESNPVLDSLKTKICLKRFENTSSTKLELQILLLALSGIPHTDKRIIIYTDSQNLIKLTERRNRLEQQNYYSNQNKRITNYQLYQKFYKITDQIDYEIVQVKGHQKASQKNHIEKIFTLVDRAARKALRNENKE